MAENEGIGGALFFVAGTLFGALVVYLAFRKEPATTAQAMTPEVQRLHTELQRLRIENDELRLKLQIAAPQGPVMTAATQGPVMTATPPTKSYKNEENYGYTTDKLGRIVNVKITREATRR